MTTASALPPRQDVLRGVVELRVPVEQAVAVLRRFSWDGDEVVDLDAQLTGVAEELDS